MQPDLGSDDAHDKFITHRDRHQVVVAREDAAQPGGHFILLSGISELAHQNSQMDGIQHFRSSDGDQGGRHLCRRCGQRIAF